MIKNNSRPLKVFLCHASGDKPAVQKLYSRLICDGVDAWLDKEKLIPGQNWQLEIQKAVRNSDVVVVCLSTQSVNKEGFVQKEIKIALDTADEKPEGTIFIIPARLENCGLPERLSLFHYVDLFSDDGYRWLLKALQLRASTVGITIEPSAREHFSIKPESQSSILKSTRTLDGVWDIVITDQIFTDDKDWIVRSKKFRVSFGRNDIIIKNIDIDNKETAGAHLGFWWQNENSIQLATTGFRLAKTGSWHSTWNGTIEGEKMAGTVSNEDGQTTTWIATLRHH